MSFAVGASEIEEIGAKGASSPIAGTVSTAEILLSIYRASSIVGKSWLDTNF